MSMMAGVEELHSTDSIESIETSHDAIEREFNKFSIEKAFIESIWNSLDANAKNISVTLDLKNEIGNVASIVIQDDGDGIQYSNIPNTFKKYKESPKHKNKGPMVKGEKGLGRFAFHRFAHNATWVSKTQSGMCEIKMNSSNLSEFSRKVIETNAESFPYETGTRLVFEHIDKKISKTVFEDRIIPYIREKLSCHLLVDTSICVKFDEVAIEPLSFNKNEKVHSIDGIEFNARYIQWDKKPSSKSYIYFISKDKKNVEHKVTTSTNNKNGFYVSAYIESEFFNNFEPVSGVLDFDDKNNLESEGFKTLLKTAKNEISDMFFKFRRDEADRLIDQYEEHGVFPDYEKDGDAPFLAEYKRDALKETIRVLYQAEPQLFSQIKSHKKQVQIFIKLLDRITFNPTDDLFDILDGVVNLSQQEERDLSNILKDNSISNITKAISAITKRQEVISILRKLIYEETKGCKEKHIQKIIESNLWLFGEQYHLLTAEEPDFEDALREFLKINDKGEYYQKGMIEHKSKQREMDIFCARRFKEVDACGNEYYRCLVIELKRASENLKDRHYNQLQDYFSVIASDKNFTDGNHVWDFVLIAKDMASVNYSQVIRGNLNRNKHDPGLVFTSENEEHRIYCRTWTNLFSGYAIKYKHLLDNLHLQAQQITQNNIDELSERAVQIGKELK